MIGRAAVEVLAVRTCGIGVKLQRRPHIEAGGVKPQREAAAPGKKVQDTRLPTSPKACNLLQDAPYRHGLPTPTGRCADPAPQASDVM